MINNKKIKKLAQIESEKNAITKDISKFVIEYIEKKELKVFLNYYKSALDKKTVHIKSAEKISASKIKEFESIYKNKDIVFSVDEELGGGFILRENDSVVDFTVKDYINKTIDSLKN